VFSARTLVKGSVIWFFFCRSLASAF